MFYLSLKSSWLWACCSPVTKLLHNKTWFCFSLSFNNFNLRSSRTAVPEQYKPSCLVSAARSSLIRRLSYASHLLKRVTEQAVLVRRGARHTLCVYDAAVNCRQVKKLLISSRILKKKKKIFMYSLKKFKASNDRWVLGSYPWF